MTVGDIYKNDHENTPVKRGIMFNGARENSKI
jgi:hypothetical protein